MIWYSHINEDNSIERQLLFQGNYRTVSCVSGSGERFIALLDHPAKDFYAIDINPDALFLLELKLKSLEYLGIRDYLAFIGHTRISPVERMRMYDNISGSLGSECTEFWNRNPLAIIKGILNMGHFETYLSSLRPMVKLFLGKGFNSVFQTGTGDAKGFPALRWKLMTNLFSKRWVHRLTGNRDPSFIGTAAQSEKIGRGLNTILESGEVMDAYVFHLIFNGSLELMPHNAVPASLQPSVLCTIRERLKLGDIRIHLVKGDYRQAIKQLGLHQQSNTFHSLSDIIGFEDPAYLKVLLDEILVGKGNMAVMRSFLVNNIHASFFKQAQICASRWKDYSALESSHMHQVFAIKTEPWDTKCSALNRMNQVSNSSCSI